MRSRFCGGVLLGVVLGLGVPLVAQGLGPTPHYQYVSGAMAKAYEQNASGIVFCTLLWFNNDDVLDLAIGSKTFLVNLNTVTGSGGLCRLR